MSCTKIVKCFYFLYTGMCVFVFRYLFFYYNIYDCVILFYITSLHFMYMNKLLSSILFKRLKKNILKIHYLKTFIHCIFMNALISNIQLKWILSWMAFFHVQVNAFIYFFFQFDIWLSMIFIYLYLLNRFNNKFNSC